MRRSLIGVMVIALAAAGCGGESPAKQRQQFLAKANDVCRHFNDLQNQVQFPTVNPLSPTISHAARAQWALALKQVVQFGQQEVRVLKTLTPPSELKDRYQMLVKLKTDAYVDLEKGSTAAKTNRRTEIEAPVLAGRKKLAQAVTLAKAMGLPRCE